jgi:hypothetical protein
LSAISLYKRHWKRQSGRERSIVVSQIARAVATFAVKPQETRILSRGNWMDASGEIVEPAILGSFGDQSTGGWRANLLDPANGIVSDQNPLTPRVILNRFCREFFGTGISKSADEAGIAV